MPESTRRAVLSSCAILAAAGPASAASPPVVATRAGKLRGATVQGVHSFKGVPYARASQRFAAPGAALPWAGVHEATAHGATAPQIRGGALPVFRYLDMSAPQSEDCLTLCLYTAGLNDGRKRAVLVWLHGGAWSTGAGTSPVLDGHALAREQDVVVVAVNHRLNVFGYLHDSGLEPGAGNNGVADMVAALAWVRENIAAFGGDPANVTIFGQSGGAAKVSAVMAAPSAKGLFHRAIMESGSGALKLASAEDAGRATHGLLAEFGLKPGEAAKLREQPAETLLAAMAKVVAAQGGANNFRPVLDGVFFREHPFESKAPATAADIPLLIGSAETEITFYLAQDPKNRTLTAEQTRARVQRFLRIDAATTERVLAAYQGAMPGASPSDLLAMIGTDQNYRMGMIQAAELKTRSGGAPAWLYMFTWRSPAMEGFLRTPHTAELPFVFGNTEMARDFVGHGPEVSAVRSRMMALWANFARTGRPQAPDVPNWPVYDGASRATMLLGNEATVANDPASAQRQALAGIARFEYAHPTSFTRD